jgi:hypothetical protein
LPSALGGQARFESGTFTKEQVELLGRVTYDVGVGVEMKWAVDGEASGAVTGNLAPLFLESYGFADARAVELPLFDDESELEAGPAFDDAFGEMLDRMLYAQLRNNVPVGLGINDKTLQNGHAVLAVGYGLDKAGVAYTRIFMGWGGNSDAWYCLPEIASYNVVHTLITMLNPVDTKTVPLVGRVTTTAGAGAAFAPVEVAGVTNLTTDANGYWAVRIDEKNLTLKPDPVTVWEESVTNVCADLDPAAADPLQQTEAFVKNVAARVGGVDYHYRQIIAAYRGMIYCMTYTATEAAYGVHLAEFDAIVAAFAFR